MLADPRENNTNSLRKKRTVSYLSCLLMLALAGWFFYVKSMYVIAPVGLLIFLALKIIEINDLIHGDKDSELVKSIYGRNRSNEEQLEVEVVSASAPERASEKIDFGKILGDHSNDAKRRKFLKLLTEQSVGSEGEELGMNFSAIAKAMSVANSSRLNPILGAFAALVASGFLSRTEVDVETAETETANKTE